MLNVKKIMKIDDFKIVEKHTLKKNPWIKESYNKKENRMEAIKWLIEKTKKKPNEITIKDFNEYGLYSLIHHYNSSTFLAVHEAFPKTKPEDMKRKPKVITS